MTSARSRAAVAPRPTILIVEDDEGLREVMAHLVESLGYEALCAGDAAEALALFERQGGAVDLLLADVVMPGMDGTELAARLLTQRPTLKVVYVSGHPDALARRGLATESVLLKPFTSAALAARLHERLDPAARPAADGTGVPAV